MDEITFQVHHDDQTGLLTASWDDPDGLGGISTQGNDIQDLKTQLHDAVDVHFDDDEAPRRIRLHFVNDPMLTNA